jgi:hypothetical protein
MLCQARIRAPNVSFGAGLTMNETAEIKKFYMHQIDEQVPKSNITVNVSSLPPGACAYVLVTEHLQATSPVWASTRCHHVYHLILILVDYLRR